jgi:hypothetical protein
VLPSRLPLAGFGRVCAPVGQARLVARRDPNPAGASCHPVLPQPWPLVAPQIKPPLIEPPLSQHPPALHWGKAASLDTCGGALSRCESRANVDSSQALSGQTVPSDARSATALSARWPWTGERNGCMCRRAFLLQRVVACPDIAFVA